MRPPNWTKLFSGFRQHCKDCILTSENRVDYSSKEWVIKNHTLPKIDDLEKLHNFCLILMKSLPHKVTILTKESLYIGEPMRQQKNLVILGYRVEFDLLSRQRIRQKFPLEKLKKSKYSQPAFLTLNIKK